MEGKGGEVVTRYPYENVRMDHLLSRETQTKAKPKVLNAREDPRIPAASGPRGSH